MSDLSRLNVGDKVVLVGPTHRDNENPPRKVVEVIRKGKKFLAVKHEKRWSNYQKFRIKDGMDFGPETYNVYYLEVKDE